MNITFRIATPTDAGAVNQLSTQLGYENTNTADTASYISSLNNSDNEELIVAEYSASVIAWMQLSYILRIESGYFGEIVGLVLDERHRSAGMGNMLIDNARNWTQRVSKKLRVMTNIVRQRAHAFYERNGFTLSKEQKVYEMNL